LQDATFKGAHFKGLFCGLGCLQGVYEPDLDLALELAEVLKRSGGELTRSS